MLKKQALKRILTSTLALGIMLLLCIFPKNETNTDNIDILYVEKEKIPIYAMDENMYVARLNIDQRKDDQIRYIISLLTIGSKDAFDLPIGFSALLPKNTKLIDYSLKDHLLKLNFSKEFLNLSADTEEKAIESLIFSLCEIEGVDKIMIFIEEKLLEKLPNSNKVLPPVLNKGFGINKVYKIDDIKNTTKATIYYMSKKNDNLYYIPITKITNSKIEPVEVIVKELKPSSIHEPNLISYLNASYELKDYEILENAITLSFNNYLITNIKDDENSEKVKYSLALSIRDTYNINDITININ